jgi:hypothetical protein
MSQRFESLSSKQEAGIRYAPSREFFSGSGQSEDNARVRWGHWRGVRRLDESEDKFRVGLQKSFDYGVAQLVPIRTRFINVNQTGISGPLALIILSFFFTTS